MNSGDGDADSRLRGPLALTALAVLGLLLFLAFVALGTWQVQRRAWKLDLIARVNARVHAPVQAAPVPARWSDVSAAADAYRHVQVRGVYLDTAQTLIWTHHDSVSGFWVMTPLKQADGAIVLVNRGFVKTGWCGRSGTCARGPAGEVSVTGLLRMSQPGYFLRRNDPASNDWYTPGVPLIAKVRGLRRVAPYFIDADAQTPGSTGDGARVPQGGLTAIHFPNNHLAYLITWYLLALGTAWGIWNVAVTEMRQRRRLRAGQSGTA